MGRSEGDPEFEAFADRYGEKVGGGDDTTTTGGRDPLFGIPAEFEKLFVLLSRSDLRMTAPGARQRRIGGSDEDDTGPTFAGGPAEQITLANLLRSYWTADRDFLARMQSDLWAAGGFYEGKERPVFGIPDDRGYKAFQKAALRAARSGKTFAEVIADALEAGGGPQEEQRAPFVGQTTNPVTLEETLDRMASVLLGRNPTDEERARYIRDYQADELAAQRRAYDAAETGGTIVRPPEADAAAADLLEEMHPADVVAHTAATSVFTNFLRLMGQSG